LEDPASTADLFSGHEAQRRQSPAACSEIEVV
jgi:hypothetical protein